MVTILFRNFVLFQIAPIFAIVILININFIYSYKEIEIY